MGRDWLTVVGRGWLEVVRSCSEAGESSKMVVLMMSAIVVSKVMSM